MYSRRLTQLLLALLVIGLLPVIALASEPTSSSGAAATSALPYEQLIEIAERLKQEKSWSLAKAHYAEALKKAPTPEQGRFVELWVEDTKWRSEGRPNWDKRERWEKNHLAIYDAMLKPYTEGLARDDFWLAVQTSRTDFEDQLPQNNQWEHRAEIAGFLASRPPSEKAALEYVGFLKRSLGLPSFRFAYDQKKSLLTPHLANGVKIGASADDRAWCAWQLARLTQTDGITPADLRKGIQTRAERWDAALALAPGTGWERPMRADDFLWKTRIGWAPGVVEGTPAKIPALLEEIQKHREALVAEKKTEVISTLDNELAELERELGNPRLNLMMNTQFLPNSPVSFSYGSVGAGQLVFQLRQLEAKEWLMREDYRRFPPTSVPKLGTLVKEWKKDVPNAEELSWTSEVEDLGSLLQPGFYILTVQGENADSGSSIVRNHLFVISGIQGIALSRASSGGELFALSATDGKPVAGAVFKALISADQAKKPVSWSGITDQEGRVIIPHCDGHQLSFAGLIGQQPFFFTHYAYSNSEFHFIADVFLDRPLYRPGETAHWKLILRERKDGRFVVPDKDLLLKMQVKLGDDVLSAPADLSLNAYGTAHGEIHIPDTARPGMAYLELLKGDESNPRFGPQRFSLFQVDNFIAPAVIAKTELLSGARSLRPGQEMVLRVNAAYFSGGPAVNLPVEGKFSATIQTRKDNETECQTWMNSLRSEARKATTDAQGIAEFRLSLPAFLPEGSSVRFNASVLPEGAQPAQTNGSYFISESGYLIDPLDWKKLRWAAPGEKVVFKARTLDGTGTAVAFDGQARLVELKWTEALLGPQGQLVSGSDASELRRTWRQQHEQGSIAFLAEGGTPLGWKSIFAEYVENTVAEVKVQVTKENVIEVPFVLPGSGLYQVQLLQSGMKLGSPNDNDWANFFRSGANGVAKIPSEALSVIAVDEHTGPLPLASDAKMLASRETYEPGVAIRAAIVVPLGASHAWLTLCGENKSISYPVKLKDRLGSCVVNDPPSFLGTGTLHLSYAYSNGETGVQIKSFGEEKKSQDLKLAITTTSAVARPGADAQVSITVGDDQGKSLPAEIAVAVSDDAVNHLISGNQNKEGPSFSRTSHVQSVRTTAFGVSRPMEIKVQSDPRPGVVLNSPWNYQDDDRIILSPFEVQAAPEAGYYAASSTLAGTRIRTDLNDIGSSINIVTGQMLQDIGATSDSIQMAPPMMVDEPDNGSDSESSSVEIRRHFSSTALWSPEILTDQNGHAQLSFKYPDNLTQWRIEAYAVGEDGNTFAKASTLTKTTLPLQARLQLPRVLVAGDSSEASASLVNRTDSDLKANATLMISGAVEAIDPARAKQQGITVPKQAEARAEWKIVAKQPGKAEFSLSAKAGKEADAMVLSLPVIEDGIQQETASTGRLAAQASDGRLSLTLPEKLARDRTQVTLQLSPSYAASMLDALPYLIDYPYGCVEQTMSRFLPAIIVRKTLIDLKLDAAAVEKRILSHESTADTTRRQKTAGLGKLDEVVKQSLARLKMAQTDSGAFDWWPGSQHTNLWMTSYVSWGLVLAKTAGVDIPDSLLLRSHQALTQTLINGSGESKDVTAFALMALSQQGPLPDQALAPIRKNAFARVYELRDRLSASGRACMSLAAKTFGTADQREILLRNLENGAQRVSAEDIGNTVHWGSTSNYWRAMDGSGEATALTLLALMDQNPEHPLIEPAVNWLLLNRRSSHWTSTRDTTFAILALTRYVQARGEMNGESEIELRVNGEKLRQVKISGDTLLQGSLSYAIPSELLRPGSNTLELHRLKGSGPVYATALCSAWAESDGIKPAANLIGVNRDFVRKKAQATLIGTLTITPEPLENGGSATIGDEVSARVRLDVSNGLEYLMVEVPKPAGFEPLNALSGWDAKIYPIEGGNESKESDRDSAGQLIYREERDDRSVFFLDRIEAGTWEIRFGLRATTVGNYRVLPAKVGAMYVPEVRANSDAQRIILKRAE